MKTTIYLSHAQIVALEKGVKELTQFNDIESSLKIFNNGKDKGSWIELEDTSLTFAFWLGFQAGFNKERK